MDNSHTQTVHSPFQPSHHYKTIPNKADMTKNWLVLVLLLPCCSNAFVIRPRQVATFAALPSDDFFGEIFCRVKNADAATLLYMSNSEGGESPTPKRKRKRKRKVETLAAPDEDEEEDEEEEIEIAAPKPAVELKPRQDSPVQLQVKDVRELVGGTSSSAATSSSSSLEQSSPVASTTSSDAASATSSKSTSSPASSFSTAPLDDSMEQLLADARRMEEEEGESEVEEEGSGGIKGTIGKALSTIVTADFFVVMAFLLWFLVGIFFSSILKDDTIQIAFNSKYISLACPPFFFVSFFTSSHIFSFRFS